MKANNLFLVGPMGAGKTTVGRILAEKLSLNFYDADEVFEQRFNQKISDFFLQNGEINFRQHEMQILADLTKLQSIVLATGGGAVLSAVNREYLIKRGTVFYLQVSIKQQLLRLQNTDRPLLQSNDLVGRLQTLQQERAHLYAKIADYVINADNLMPEQIAKSIALNFLQNQINNITRVE